MTPTIAPYAGPPQLPFRIRRRAARALGMIVGSNALSSFDMVPPTKLQQGTSPSNLGCDKRRVALDRLSVTVPTDPRGFLRLLRSQPAYRICCGRPPS